MTMATRAVLAAMAERPEARHYGYDLSRRSGVRSGVMYPILARLLAAGWVEDGWEDAETAHTQQRPPRRYYTLTEQGRDAAQRGKKQ